MYLGSYVCNLLLGPCPSIISMARPIVCLVSIIQCIKPLLLLYFQLIRCILFFFSCNYVAIHFIISAMPIFYINSMGQNLQLNKQQELVNYVIIQSLNHATSYLWLWEWRHRLAHTFTNMTGMHESPV